MGSFNLTDGLSLAGPIGFFDGSLDMVAGSLEGQIDGIAKFINDALGSLTAGE